MADDNLGIDVVDRVAVLTLRRAEVRNALTPALVSTLAEAVADLDRNDDIDVLVLTGADPAFCAGIDLKEAAAGSGVRHLPGRGPFGPRTKVLIGAINGPAVTGGLELALNCDFLIASERARFADTHVRVGVQPGWGMTVLLSRIIGVNRAKQMSLTGNYIDAATAQQWGLVNEVVPHTELLSRSLRLAQDCSSSDQRAVRRLLQTYAEGFDVTAARAWEIEDAANQEWLQEEPIAERLGAQREAVTERGRAQLTDASRCDGHGDAR